MINEKKNSLVSVIIPTYKRPNMLGRAIDSVLNQTYDNIEIIVVDDNDEDSEYRKETEKFMNKYSKVSNLVYLKHKNNKNGAAARNTGIYNAKGEYISFLDDDDEFLPKKIELQVDKLIKSSEKFAAVYCNKNFYLNGIKYNVSGNKKIGNLKKDILSFDISIGAGSTLLIEKKVLLELGGFDEDFLRHQDVEILVRYFNKYKIELVEFPPLVNIYKDSRINSPSSKEVIKIKEKFLLKFKTTINQFEESQRNYIVKKNNIEIANSLVRENKFLRAYDILSKTNTINIKDYLFVFMLNPIKKNLKEFNFIKYLWGKIN